jgi:AcrR family transcriptional regulator
VATESGPTRRTRERELVLATRALFDERGMQHAPIEEVAQSVGIARGLIYRIFSSKEELYVLTVTDYLDELHVALAGAAAGRDDPRERLEVITRAFATFCLRYPAFLDCAISLMQRPAADLQHDISDSVWVRLGQGMARCLDAVARVVRDGNAAGDWDVEDPDFAANALWTQGIGLMHLARIGVGVREAVPGLPELFAVDSDRVVEACVNGALALMHPHPA